MKLRFFVLVELVFFACCLIHVTGFPLQEDDDISSEDEMWKESEDAEEEDRDKRLWRHWEDDVKRNMEIDNVKDNLYKRLWRNWSAEDDDLVEGNEMKRETGIKKLWRSQENVSEPDSLCVPCGEKRCKRSPDKMLPQGGKTLPCCNC